MKTVLESWVGERVQTMVLGFPPNVTFEGRLEEVNDEILVLRQDSGVVSVVLLSNVLAAHHIPIVTLMRPQLEIVGPRKTT